MPAYCPTTARAAEAISRLPVDDAPRRPLDRDVIDCPRRRAAVAPQEGERNVAADGQQIGRMNRHGARAAANLAGPPNACAAKARAGKASAAEPKGAAVGEIMKIVEKYGVS
jgi:hypothetical protein